MKLEWYFIMINYLLIEDLLIILLKNFDVCFGVEKFYEIVKNIKGVYYNGDFYIVQIRQKV